MKFEFGLGTNKFPFLTDLNEYPAEDVVNKLHKYSGALLITHLNIKTLL